METTIIVRTTVVKNKKLISDSIRDRVINNKQTIKEAMLSFYLSGKLSLSENWEKFQDKVYNLVGIKDAIKALHKLETAKPAVEKVVDEEALEIVSQIDLPTIDGVNSHHLQRIVATILRAGAYPPLGEVLGIIAKYLSVQNVLNIGEMKVVSLSYVDKYKEILLHHSMDTNLSEETRKYLGKRAVTLNSSNSWKFKEELPHVASKLGVPQYVVDEIVDARPEVRLTKRSHYIDKAEEILISLVESNILDVNHYDWQIDAGKQASVLVHQDMLDTHTRVSALNELVVTAHNEGGVSSFAPMWDIVNGAGNKSAKFLKKDLVLVDLLDNLNKQKFVYRKEINSVLEKRAELLANSANDRQRDKILWKLNHNYNLATKDSVLTDSEDIAYELKAQVGQYFGGFYNQHGCDTVNRINSYNPIGHMSGSTYKYHIGTPKQYLINSNEVKPLLVEAIKSCQGELDKLKDKEDFSSLSKRVALTSRLSMLVKDHKRGWSNLLAELDVHNSGYQILAILTKNKKLAGLTAMLDGEDGKLRDKVLNQFLRELDLEPSNIDTSSIAIKYPLMTLLYNIGAWKLVFNAEAAGDDWDGLLATVMAAVPNTWKQVLIGIGVDRKSIDIAFGEPDPMADDDEKAELNKANWKIVNKLNKAFEKALFKVAPIVNNFRTMFNGLIDKYCSPTKKGEYVWRVGDSIASVKPTYTYTEELGEFLYCNYTDFSVTVPNPEYRNGLLARVIQSIDAYILRLVLTACFEEGIQVLSQHDAFLVPFNKVSRVKDIYSEIINSLPVDMLQEIIGSIVDKKYADSAKALIGTLVGEELLFDGENMLTLEA